ncbi:MAG TPA: hypothetical protein VHU86_03565 [Solirubrobacterales bacterium]|nr:hypothetical protein [Solirubrobacterales bacterium]
MNSPQGVAVDQTTGNVYVTDGNNQRVEQYDANGTFLRAFGQDVVESGPDNAPAISAVQTLTVTATGGKYKLKFGGKETAELAFNSPATQVQTALSGLTSIGAGNLTVSETSSQVYKLTFAGNLANNPEPLIATESGPGEPLTGGIAGNVNTTSGSSGFETCVAANGDVCKTGVTGETGGAFKSTFNGYPAVAPAGSPNAGDVLVADPANLRVQEFSSAGAFVRTFGFDVVKAGPDNTGTAFEVCNASAGDACKIGVTGAGAGQFANSVNRVAEDAAGNLYTVESTVNFRVQKFTLPGNVVTPSGTFSEANTKGTAAASAPFDIAIDPSDNDVLVAKAFAAGATPTCPNTGVASLAERRIVEVSSTGTLEATHMACAGITPENGIAVRGSSGDVYVSSTTPESRLFVLNTPLAAPTVGFSGVSEVSAHGTTVSGFVNPNGPAFAYGLTTGFHVNYKRSTDSTFLSAPPTDVNVGKGTTNVVVSQPLLGLEANTTYEVQIVGARPFNGGNASTSTFSFTTPSVAPEISVPTSTTGDPSGTAASVYGFVNPNSQATTYRFEYGSTSSYGSSSPAAGGSAGSGAAQIAVAQTLTGLEPGTTYHFRLRANNATGGVVSADQTFTTAQPSETALPDGRGFEIVSPPDKRPAGTVKQVVQTNLNWQIADGGQRTAYTIQNGLTDATAGGEVIYIAHRNPEGWSSAQASPPSLISGKQGGTSSYVLGWNPAVTCGFAETQSPLTDDVPQVDRENEVGNLYRENEDGTFTLISNLAPSNPQLTFGINPVYYVFGGASEDCSRVIFSTQYQLLPGASASSGMYEWNNGVLRDMGLRPDGTVARTPNALEPGPPLMGGEFTNPRASRYNAVSSDAKQVAFTATSDEGADKGKQAVFLSRGGVTVDVSQPTTGTLPLGARYEVASTDGTQVLFAANAGLAGPAGVAPQENCAGAEMGAAVACDLYDYNRESGALTDLTTDFNQADSKGAVVQGVLGLSKDGSYVYFAAKGQLVPAKGKTFAENNGTTKSSNVYLYHAGQLSFVANIRDTDLNGSAVGGFQGNAVLIRSMVNWSTYVPPSGKEMVFESRSNVTGYESGNNAEAYLYSADSKTLTCVSCRANGQPSPVVTENNIVITSVLPGRANSQASTRGLHYNRPMSDDGTRVFFFSTDALAPGGVAGSRNTYEWENGKVSLIATGTEKLIGTSTSGDDVFLTTRSRLVPQDFDLEYDLYDARVGGGFPAEPASIPCEPAADQCQGAPTPPPAVSAAQSSGFVGPNNPPAPKQKHKKKHHKKRRRHPSGHHHKKSNRQAGRTSNRAPRVNNYRGGAK